MLKAEYLLLYVDDMLLISKKKGKIAKMKSMLRSEFDMKDLGLAGSILGMKIGRNRNKDALLLSQQGYSEKLIDKFSMKGAKPTKQALN